MGEGSLSTDTPVHLTQGLVRVGAHDNLQTVTVLSNPRKLACSPPSDQQEHSLASVFSLQSRI